MTEPPAPQRPGVLWSPEPRTDLRAIDRDSALQILYCLDRFLASRAGDVNKLKPPFTGMRLRCGDYRVFFDLKGNNIEITAVRHRKDAYRYRLSLPKSPFLLQGESNRTGAIDRGDLS